MPSTDFIGRYRGRLAQLNHAYAAGDAAAFESALDALNEGRETAVMTGVMKLSDNLQQALWRFRADSRMAVLAHQEIPDARLRLEHVLTLTEDAAHKTMDLIERSVPLVNATVRNTNALMAALEDRSHNEIRRFLEETRGNFESVRANLSEVMLAQSFQDLTGQILRGADPARRGAADWRSGEGAGRADPHHRRYARARSSRAHRAGRTGGAGHHAERGQRTGRCRRSDGGAGNMSKQAGRVAKGAARRKTVKARPVAKARAKAAPPRRPPPWQSRHWPVMRST